MRRVPENWVFRYVPTQTQLLSLKKLVKRNLLTRKPDFWVPDPSLPKELIESLIMHAVQVNVK